MLPSKMVYPFFLAHAWSSFSYIFRFVDVLEDEEMFSICHLRVMVDYSVSSFSCSSSSSSEIRGGSFPENSCPLHCGSSPPQSHLCRRSSSSSSSTSLRCGSLPNNSYRLHCGSSPRRSHPRCGPPPIPIA